MLCWTVADGKPLLLSALMCSVHMAMLLPLNRCLKGCGGVMRVSWSVLSIVAWLRVRMLQDSDLLAAAAAASERLLSLRRCLCVICGDGRTTEASQSPAQ
jgi:hypothetical protein